MKQLPATTKESCYYGFFMNPSATVAVGIVTLGVYGIVKIVINKYNEITLTSESAETLKLTSVAAC